MPTNETTQRYVTHHVALLLWSIVTALTLLAVVCIYKPPQDWTNASLIITTLKDLALLIAGGWLALLRSDSPDRAPATLTAASKEESK